MPDRAEIAKRVAQAEKLLQRGKTGDALDEYLQVLLEDLFERQVALGDAIRASLTYKKLARHGSPTWQQKFRFGQLLENTNKKLAIGTYENALDDMAKQRKKPESLQVMTRIVTLEPTQGNYLRLGELCSQLGESKAAAAGFHQAAELAEAAGADASQYF